MARMRRDVVKLGPGWNNTLLWYAKAIEAMDALPISDRTSWRFLAAMHGFDSDQWREANLLRAGEEVPTDLANETFANQCQHGSWYFLPWHRGYLWAFEEIVAAKVKELGGDPDWALPYWNYLDTSNPDARRIPAAFLQLTMPDGKPNPLNKPPRRNAKVLAPFGNVPDIRLKAMSEPDFIVGGDGAVGLGGGVTSLFSHSGGRAGELESNPHNPVHVMVGGFEGGFMSDFNLAGLDPLFWLHHCNIDRLWEAWMHAPGRKMTDDSRWRNGPTARRFMMPRPGGTVQNFTPRDTLAGGSLHPTYDDLVAGTGVAPTAPAAQITAMTMGSTRDQTVEVLGANNEEVKVGATAAKTTVTLDPGPAMDAVHAMGPIAVGTEAVRLYLQLENLTGASPSAVIDVFVNLPDHSVSDADKARYRADSLYLFGLNKASAKDGSHSGNGLGFTIDITDLAKRLSDAGEFDPQQVNVSIAPVGGASAEKPVTVRRVSVLKRKVTAQP